MAFESFKAIESKDALTSLNGLSVARALGGLALGYGMVKYNLSPELVFGSTVVLAASDMEGSLYTGTKRFPRLQKALRIWPSELGRKLDPLADKIFGVSVFAGGLISETLPTVPSAAILATEVVTAGTTLAVTAINDGEAPEVSNIGKAGMIARCGAVVSYLAANVVESQPVHDAMMYAGHASSFAAVALGGISSWLIARQAGNGNQEQAPVSL